MSAKFDSVSPLPTFSTDEVVSAAGYVDACGRARSCVGGADEGKLAAPGTCENGKLKRPSWLISVEEEARCFLRGGGRVDHVSDGSSSLKARCW